MGPVLIHVVTEKGRGYLPAETASDKMHGVVQYDTVTGQQAKSKGVGGRGGWWAKMVFGAWWLHQGLG